MRTPVTLRALPLSPILAPACLGIVLGLMLGPVATKLEKRGLRPGVSASLVVILFIAAICLFAAAVAAPLSFWLSRLPQLWSNLQLQLSELKAPLEALRGVRDQLRELTGAEGLTVSVDEGTGVESMALLAPAVVAQILIFLACLYFFVATRNQTRAAILKLCIDRRLRWRVAHIFRDVESMVSRYLLSITIINLVEGAAVGVDSISSASHRPPSGARLPRSPISSSSSARSSWSLSCSWSGLPSSTR